mmetsp:Transcript_42320/g.30994  ORF Transcript_42320/g.30994 Transcript_42320/m.30994 type:complete len:130 (+) Transcript_42320:1094-1483(+)
MIKKREKMNNSALATHASKLAPGNALIDATPQLVSHLNKLYSQKRTPTNGNQPAYPMQPYKKQQSKSKEKGGVKFGGLTQEGWLDPGKQVEKRASVQGKYPVLGQRQGSKESGFRDPREEAVRQGVQGP